MLVSFLATKQWQSPELAYDAAKNYLFHPSLVGHELVIEPGQFAVFFPRMPIALACVVNSMATTQNL
jgi:beta-galactosidase beta subunit